MDKAIDQIDPKSGQITGTIPSAFPILSTLLLVVTKLNVDAGAQSEHTWSDGTSLVPRRIRCAEAKKVSILGHRKLLRDGTLGFDVLHDAALLALPDDGDRKLSQRISSVSVAVKDEEHGLLETKYTALERKKRGEMGWARFEKENWQWSKKCGAHPCVKVTWTPVKRQREDVPESNGHSGGEHQSSNAPVSVVGEEHGGGEHGGGEHGGGEHSGGEHDGGEHDGGEHGEEEDEPLSDDEPEPQEDGTQPKKKKPQGRNRDPMSGFGFGVIVVDDDTSTYEAYVHCTACVLEGKCKDNVTAFALADVKRWLEHKKWRDVKLAIRQGLKKLLRDMKRAGDASLAKGRLAGASDERLAEMENDNKWDIDSVQTVYKLYKLDDLDPRQYRWIRDRWAGMFEKLDVNLKVKAVDGATGQMVLFVSDRKSQCELIWYAVSKAYYAKRVQLALNGEAVIICGMDRTACHAVVGTFLHLDATTTTEAGQLPLDEGKGYRGDRKHIGKRDETKAKMFWIELVGCVLLTYATSISLMLLAYVTRHTLGSLSANRSSTGKDPNLFLEESELTVFGPVRDAWLMSVKPTSRKRRVILPLATIAILLCCIILRGCQLRYGPDHPVAAPGLGNRSSAGLLRGSASARFPLAVVASVIVFLINAAILFNISKIIPITITKRIEAWVFNVLGWGVAALWILESKEVIGWHVGNGVSDLILIFMALLCEVRLQGHFPHTPLHPDHGVLAASLMHLILYGQWA
ncbi:hypothetical protein HDV00_008620 [Rhizophlyctis rosea]|nr:hypothetical protein HDV00_008620 [Rhizophlyctis rosea]